MAKKHVNPWPRALLVDLALEADPTDEVLQRHEVTLEQFLVYRNTPAFKVEFDAVRKELDTGGVSFRQKAQVVADEALTEAYLMIKSPDTPPAVKATLAKEVVRWAGYEPKPEGGTTAGSGFSLTINLGQPQPPPPTIDVPQPLEST